MAKFVVVGAGVIGVASAWKLSKLGHQVTLIDRNSNVCDGASRRNGAQLSYSYCDTLGSPTILSNLRSILRGTDPALSVTLVRDLEFLLWGARFLWNCRSNRAADNTRLLMSIAAETQRQLVEVLSEFAISFNYAVAGKLVLCSSLEAMKKSQEMVNWKRSLGINIDLLSSRDAVQMEPALDSYSGDIFGAVFSPDDAVGQPDRFCSDLVVGLKAQYGLQTRFSCEARKLISRAGKIVGVEMLNGETELCDGVIIATGYDNSLLPLSQRITDSTWTVQGYSFTAKATAQAMRISITDPARRLVFARLGDDVRVAGLADIGRRGVVFNPERFEVFKQQAQDAFSDCLDLSGEVFPWSDARPCTPSSRPVIARGKMQGTYFNFGHGAFGWTLCLGSAKTLGQLVSEDWQSR